MSFVQKIKGMHKTTLLVLLVGLVVCVLIVVTKPKEKPIPFVAPAPPEVNVVEVTPVSASVVVNSQGTVEPKIETQLVSQVAGQVVWVSDSFVAGGFFKAGEVLLRIDPRDYEIALAQQQSVLANAEQVLAEERGRALQAKREWRDLNNSEANALFLRKPQIAAAEAQIVAAKASVNKAKLDLERTRFSLPFDGRVRAASADIGQYITFGSSVGEAFSSGVLEVRLPLTANQVRILGLTSRSHNALNLPVTIKAQYGNQLYQWRGSVMRTEASVDPQTRLFYVIAEVTIQEQQAVANLEVGLFVEAEITSIQHEDVVVLPRTALVDRSKVMIVNDNRAEVLAVDVLAISADEIRVQGLMAGQHVLLTPPGFLASGSIVTPLLTSTKAVAGRGVE